MPNQYWDVERGERVYASQPISRRRGNDGQVYRYTQGLLTTAAASAALRGGEYLGRQAVDYASRKAKEFVDRGQQSIKQYLAPTPKGGIAPLREQGGNMKLKEMFSSPPSPFQFKFNINQNMPSVRGRLDAGLRMGTRPPKPGVYQKYGSYGEDEAYNKTEEDEAVYIGLTSFKAHAISSTGASVSGSLVYHVGAALLRYIIRKEFDFDVTSHDQKMYCKSLQTNISTGATMHLPKLTFYYQTMTMASTGAQVYSISPLATIEFDDTNVVKTFKEVALEIAGKVIGNPLFGATVDHKSNTHQIHGYVVRTMDAAYFNSAQNVRENISSVRPLDKLYIQAYSTAEIMVQNVTLADNAVGTATDAYNALRIDSNPLKGHVLKFSTPFPDAKPPTIDQGFAFDTAGYNGTQTPAPTVTITEDAFAQKLRTDLNCDGIIIPSIAPTKDFIQLANPEQFNNCVGFDTFYCDPGHIRKAKLHFKFDGLLKNFIVGLAYRAYSQTATPVLSDFQRYNSRQALGTSVLICMEKAVSTGTSQKVSVNYGVSYYAGAVVKRVIRPVLKSIRTDNTYEAVADDM